MKKTYPYAHKLYASWIFVVKHPDAKRSEEKRTRCIDSNSLQGSISYQVRAQKEKSNSKRVGFLYIGIGWIRESGISP